MKQSDVAMIIVVGIVGVIVAFFACNAILGDPNDEKATFKTVEAVSAEVAEPDADIFNSDAINPTVEVYTTQGVTDETTGEE